MLRNDGYGKDSCEDFIHPLDAPRDILFFSFQAAKLFITPCQEHTSRSLCEARSRTIRENALQNNLQAHISVHAAYLAQATTEMINTLYDCKQHTRDNRPFSVRVARQAQHTLPNTKHDENSRSELTTPRTRHPSWIAVKSSQQSCHRWQLHPLGGKPYLYTSSVPSHG